MITSPAPLRPATLATVLLLLAASPLPVAAASADAGYAVVVSRAALDDPGWKAVAEALRERHGGTLVPWTNGVAESAAALRTVRPRCAGFVARPAEATREFVAAVHALTRDLDADPYTDVLWGIVTGYDASNALAIARCAGPLLARRALAGTEIALDACESGVWYDELRQGHAVRKDRGGAPREVEAPPDTTRALAAELASGSVDLLVTSGHATERDWQIGYRYRNGQFRSSAGRMDGVEASGARFPVVSPNPKVYLAVGNCLMGHIDGPDAMALAWMNACGVVQMAGYTQPTWFGYMGWGLLDYFLEQPGRFTAAEAFFANLQALHRELERQPDSKGLKFDRDVVAFYGDPALDARMAPGPLRWEQTLAETNGVFTFTVLPKFGNRSFEPVNVNGSQRGGRPAFQFLPRRIGRASVLGGADLQPVVTENFLLVPLPAACDTNRAYRVVFSAAP